MIIGIYGIDGPVIKTILNAYYDTTSIQAWYLDPFARNKQMIVLDSSDQLKTKFLGDDVFHLSPQNKKTIQSVYHLMDEDLILNWLRKNPLHYNARDKNHEGVCFVNIPESIKNPWKIASKVITSKSVKINNPDGNNLITIDEKEDSSSILTIIEDNFKAGPLSQKEIEDELKSQEGESTLFGLRYIGDSVVESGEIDELLKKAGIEKELLSEEKATTEAPPEVFAVEIEESIQQDEETPEPIATINNSDDASRTRRRRAGSPFNVDEAMHQLRGMIYGTRQEREGAIRQAFRASATPQRFLEDSPMEHVTVLSNAA